MDLCEFGDSLVYRVPRLPGLLHRETLSGKTSKQKDHPGLHGEFDVRLDYLRHRLREELTSGQHGRSISMLCLMAAG